MHKMKNLDLARGLAALAVCAFHMRHFMFGEWSDQHASAIWRPFFLLTSFGHEAVMVFFVLSGYLIGQSTLRSADSPAGVSWASFAWRRLTRLWIVLIPAIILCAFWDMIGSSHGAGAFYSGSLGPISAAPVHDFGVGRNSLTAAIGNLFFLQTIIVPTFGSDGPLWSLSNEAIYYLLFPLLFELASRRTTAAVKILCAAGLLLAFAVFPRPLLLSGLIWLLGVGVAVVERRYAAFLKQPHPILLACTAGLFAAALLLDKAGFMSGPLSEYAVGSAFGLMLLPLAHFTNPPPRIAAAAERLSDFSYTLYAVHLPFVGALYALLQVAPRTQVGITNFGLYLALLGVVVAYAAGVYWLTERHTKTIQRAIPQWFRPAGIAV